ncbi:hypothetical protein EKI60_02645 [Candidatus Saccharibacteria bacterium]|nr:MAG: hypothetical protein EKI60_02645 [Candidatus Saccharibacteria bacterium]
MTVVDTNTIINSINNGGKLPSIEITVSDDLYYEYLVAEARHNKKFEMVKLASSMKGYDEAHYLKEYATMLNKFTGVSFAKMRGFADVSILALVSCLVTDYGRRPPQTTLEFGTIDTSLVTVITKDGPLKKMLADEFGNQVNIMSEFKG